MDNLLSQQVEKALDHGESTPAWCSLRGKFHRNTERERYNLSKESDIDTVAGESAVTSSKGELHHPVDIFVITPLAFIVSR